MVATIGARVRLIAVKAAILPVPDSASPIDGELLVQLYTIVPPVVGLLKITGLVNPPLQITWLGTVLTVAVGLTVIVKLMDGPVQVTPPLVKLGVTVIVATTGALVALRAVNAGTLPDPFAGRPMDGVLLVQLYTTVTPVLGVVKLTAVVRVLLHTTWFATAFTTGVGLTVIVKLIGVPTQLVPPLV